MRFDGWPLTKKLETPENVDTGSVFNWRIAGRRDAYERFPPSMDSDSDKKN
jgi:hypothetical protein